MSEEEKSKLVPAKMPVDLFKAPPAYVKDGDSIEGWIKRSDIIALENGDTYVKIGAKVKSKSSAKYSIFLSIGYELRCIFIPKGVKTKWLPTTLDKGELNDLITITEIYRGDPDDPMPEEAEQATKYAPTFWLRYTDVGYSWQKVSEEKWDHVSRTGGVSHGNTIIRDGMHFRGTVDGMGVEGAVTFDGNPPSD